eukprot:8378014-Pyramimonas_sp.AAC.1
MIKKKLVKAHALADRDHVQKDPDAAVDSASTQPASDSLEHQQLDDAPMPVGLGPVAAVKRMLVVDDKLAHRLKAFASAVSAPNQGPIAIKRTHKGLATACGLLWNGIATLMSEASFGGDVDVVAAV